MRIEENSDSIIMNNLKFNGVDIKDNTIPL